MPAYEAGTEVTPYAPCPLMLLCSACSYDMDDAWNHTRPPPDHVVEQLKKNEVRRSVHCSARGSLYWRGYDGDRVMRHEWAAAAAREWALGQEQDAAAEDSYKMQQIQARQAAWDEEQNRRARHS